MIKNKDIETILIRDLSKVVDVDNIFVSDDIPEGAVTKERVVIIVKRLSVSDIFSKCYVEVNWCVPDIGNSANSARLGEVERFLCLDGIGEYDDTTYRYGVESTEVLKSDLKCHYLNTRLLFEILNVE